MFIADYVLMGYGTGAIMAVPAHDQRDFEFAHEFDLPLVAVVQPPDEWLAERTASVQDATDWPEAYVGDGVAINSENESVSLNGLRVEDAKRTMNDWLEATGLGAPAITYKLRDWLFSRQRYWGEPFPIVYDEHGPVALPEAMLPVELPEASRTSSRSPPTIPTLSRSRRWHRGRLGRDHARPRRHQRGRASATGRRRTCARPTRCRSGPGRAGTTCATSTRRTKTRWSTRRWKASGPKGTRANGEPKVGVVDFYVGGVEHAVLAPLYARFWHKVLYDLGHVSTPEPFQRLVNQGYILAPAFIDERGQYVEASQVEAARRRVLLQGQPVTREFGKMGKSLKNAVSPDDIFREYGADTLRLYEMFMGPLDKERPWNTSDIMGVHRFLQRLWRNLIDEDTGAVRVSDAPADAETLPHAAPHHRRRALRHGSGMSFNTAIARLFELNNHLVGGRATRNSACGRGTVRVDGRAPRAAHRGGVVGALGHADTLAYEGFPDSRRDIARRVATVTVPIQVNGKVRARIQIAAGADEAAHKAAARAEPALPSCSRAKRCAR